MKRSLLRWLSSYQTLDSGVLFRKFAQEITKSKFWRFEESVDTIEPRRILPAGMARARAAANVEACEAAERRLVVKDSCLPASGRGPRCLSRATSGKIRHGSPSYLQEEAADL